MSSIAGEYTFISWDHEQETTQINESINRFMSKGGGERKKKTRKKRQLTSNYILMDITLIRKNIISILNDDLIDKLKKDGTMRPDADLNSKKVKEIVKNLKINDIDFLVNKWYNEHYPETSSIKTKNKIGGNGDDICAICHINLDDRELRTLVGCRHIFHNDCIGMWFETSRTCPMCRKFEPIRMRERLAIFIRTTLVNNFFLRIVRNEEPLRQLAIELDYNFIATHFISVGIILPYTGRNYPAQIPHSDWRTSTEIFIGSFGSAALISGGLLLWARMYPRQDDPPEDPPNEPPHQEGGRRKKKTRKKKTRKKKGGRRKTRKKKTRKKRGGQEIIVGQEWKIENDERLAQAFGNNPVFSFIKIIEEAETPLGGPGKRWKVSPSATRNFSSNTLDMYEFAIKKNYYILYKEEEEPPATEDEEEEEVMDDLKGGRRKKRGESLICKPKKNDDGTDMTYDNNGEPAIGLVLGEKYRFLCADTRRYIGTLIEIDGGGGREHKLRVQGFDERKWRYDLDVMMQPNPIFKGNREERLRKNRMIPCSEEDHPRTGDIARADGAGGGKRRKKSKRNTRKKKGGGQPTIKDIKYGSAWVHQDTKKRYKISNPYPDLEYKDGGFIVLVRDPEYDPNDKKIYKYKKSKDLFQNFALAREVWDAGGEGGGGAAASGGRKKKTRKRRKKKR